MCCLFRHVFFFSVFLVGSNLNKVQQTPSRQNIAFMWLWHLQKTLFQSFMIGCEQWKHQGKSIKAKHHFHAVTSWGSLEPGQPYGAVVELECSKHAEKAAELLKYWHSISWTRGVFFLQTAKMLSRQLVSQTQPPVAGWIITYYEDVSEIDMNLEM